jgi:hypothetical protein
MYFRSLVILKKIIKLTFQFANAQLCFRMHFVCNICLLLCEKNIIKSQLSSYKKICAITKPNFDLKLPKTI